MGDGGEQHDARCGFAVELHAAVLVDHRAQVVLELGDAAFTGERLVVAEVGEDDIRLAELEVIFGGGESLLARAGGHGVAREGQVAEDEFLLRQLALNEGFHPSVVLHPVGQAVADFTDHIVFMQLHYGDCGGVMISNQGRLGRCRGGHQAG